MGGQTTVTHTGPDPCYLAQNAVRPCTSADMEALKPQGVDPNLLAPGKSDEGRPLGADHHANGTYAFRSEAHNGAQAQAGSFAASNGAWTMKAKNRLCRQRELSLSGAQHLHRHRKAGRGIMDAPELAQVAMGCTVNGPEVGKIPPTSMPIWSAPGSFRSRPETGCWR